VAICSLWQALKGRDRPRYLAPSGLDIRLIGLRTLGAAQGFVGPPLRGLRGFETTSSVFPADEQVEIALALTANLRFSVAPDLD